MATANTASPVRRYNLRSQTPRHLQIFNPPLEPCGDFHLFARFPADIRWLVWQHSLSHERWIDITLDRFDYTDLAHEVRELANSEEYNIVLSHRWRTSKLFRTTTESRTAALAFYRVQLPCWYKSKEKVMSRGRLYVCPELDHFFFQGVSFEYFERFAHDVWAYDPHHIGLINIALSATFPSSCFERSIIPNYGPSLLRQGLSRIERLTMMNYGGSKRLSRQSRHPSYQMNHVVPIRSGVQSFDRLPYDPRLHGEDLKQVFLGDIYPQTSFNRWFKLLSTSMVRHDHKVIYQFGSCRGNKTGHGYRDPVIHDRKSAVEWIRQDTDELQQWVESLHQSPDLRGQVENEMARVFEESPHPVIGFWLFPMESVFIPEDPNIHAIPVMSGQFATAQQAANAHTNSDEVLMDQYGTGSGADVLYTVGLATCVRVAVTGTYPAGSRGGNDRFLAHISEDEPHAALQGLINSVNEAKRNGMRIDKARVVVGDYSDNSDFDSNNESDQENNEEQNKFTAKVGASILELVGGSGSGKLKRKTHAEEKVYELRIDGQKRILFKWEDGAGWESSDSEED
ncbi:uncharacterized protein FSUBG_2293 [Fusarium subglutinans]|uniref:2EXR domain-containing protein n=1 Tax=Gibberella subglutinans TaxID=42677 RepID=A0A8H5Q9P4_GIBSU|nr:uncharacterized protein FSUBG_2293 [Fusarium subglutinans]KAF5611460.1 hypothetical protein FSUBG_2293 [Fusarium subglutinans]